MPAHRPDEASPDIEGEIDFLSAKVENLLFVIWVQDQRHDYWMKFITEVKEAMENLREEIEHGDKGMVELKGGLQTFENIHADALQAPEGEIPVAGTPFEGDVEIPTG